MIKIILLVAVGARIAAAARCLTVWTTSKALTFTSVFRSFWISGSCHGFFVIASFINAAIRTWPAMILLEPTPCGQQNMSLSKPCDFMLGPTTSVMVSLSVRKPFLSFMARSMMLITPRFRLRLSAFHLRFVCVCAARRLHDARVLRCCVAHALS